MKWKENRKWKEFLIFSSRKQDSHSNSYCIVWTSSPPSFFHSIFPFFFLSFSFTIFSFILLYLSTYLSIYSYIYFLGNTQLRSLLRIIFHPNGLLSFEAISFCFSSPTSISFFSLFALWSLNPFILHGCKDQHTTHWTLTLIWHYEVCFFKIILRASPAIPRPATSCGLPTTTGPRRVREHTVEPPSFWWF